MVAAASLGGRVPWAAIIRHVRESAIIAAVVLTISGPVDRAMAPVIARLFDFNTLGNLRVGRGKGAGRKSKSNSKDED